MSKRSTTKRASKPKRPVNKEPYVPKEVIRFTPTVYGFPKSLQTRLRYSDVFTITSSAGAVGKQVYRWNSTFDPDLTNVGHQPLYRDSFAGIYDQYAVVKAKATIRILTADATAAFAVGCVTDDDGTTSASVNTLSEQNTGHVDIISPLSGSHSYTVFTPTWSAHQDLNINPYTSETYKTAVGSDPTEISTLLIWAATVGGSSATITMQIVLEQEVVWTELTTPTAS
jgi:hypothetical protein